MIRILGFVIGSFLAVGVLLALVGTPDVGRRTGGDARMDEAIENLKRKWEEPAAPATTVAPDPVSTAGEQADPPREAAVDRTGEMSDDLATYAPDGSADSMAAGTSADPTGELPGNSGADPVGELPGATANPPAPPAVAAAEPGWHVFWTPFRTEIAARGFVGRLESVTGLDYRVTKLRTGTWQVAFAYENPADVDAGLERIAAATGLDLAAARP